MIPAISISEIVRQVSDNIEPKSGYEQRIVINTDTGQAVPAPGIFDYVLGSFTYYLIANNRNAQKIISGSKTVKYREGNEEIVFVVDYKGGCPPGYEAQLGQFFFRTTGPDKAIGDSLGKWLMEFFTTNGRTIDQFYTENDGASRDLATKALSEFGLALTITLTIENSTKPEPLEIGPIVLTSRLLDSDDEEKLSIKVELEADPQNLLRAMLNRKTPLTDVVKKGVRQHLASRITLDTYYKDLNSERVKQGLREQVNSLLKQFGRRVVFVSLKPEGGGGEPPSPHNGETTIEYKHHECPEPIKLRISVLMTPQDATRYRAKGSPSLPRWLQQNLEEVVRMVLFGFSYVDLLLDFRPAKQKIIEEMNRRAASIGYKIEQLMTMISMDPLTWRKGFDVEIKVTESNPNAAMFATSVSGVSVGLEVFLTARVKDLRGVTRYLTSDLPQKVKEEVFRLVGTTLHATDPQQFYKYYREADKKKPGGGPFEHELRGKICYLLESEFNAEVIQLVLKPTDTDLTDKLFKVASTSHDFLATSEIGATPGAPKISVHGSFTVESVSADGWEKFREREVTAEKLTKRVKDSVSAFIKRTPESADALSSQEAVVELIKHALHSARMLIDDEFGVAIKLATISWEWDESLIKIVQLRNQEDLDAIHTRISKLKDLLLDYYEHDESQEAIDEVRASIARLSAMVPAGLGSSVGYRELPEPPRVKKLTAAEPDSQPSSIGQTS